MALAIVQELIQEYLQTLLKEGVLNNTFCHIVAQTNSENVVEQIRIYCDEMEALLSNAMECIEFNDIDHSKLAKDAQGMEEKSLRFGAEFVRRASAQLIQSFQSNDKKERLSQDTKWVKTEYCYTKEKLDVIVQMERKIIRIKNKQNGGKGTGTTPPHSHSI